MKISSIIIIFTFVLLSLQCECDNKESKKSRKARKKARKTSNQNHENLQEEKEYSSITYNSEKEKEEKIAEIHKKILLDKNYKNNPNSENNGIDLIKLKKEEIELNKNLLDTIKNYGSKSLEKAKALHLLG